MERNDSAAEDGCGYNLTTSTRAPRNVEHGKGSGANWSLYRKKEQRWPTIRRSRNSSKRK